MQMKLVIAIIKPFLLDEVRDALVAAGVTGLIITEVKGFGRQKGHTQLYGGSEYSVLMIPKLRIEIAVPADQVDQTIKAIIASARTGEIGDGKIFVSPIDRTVRIRTGEEDLAAL
jgi:nitrogen regulatory protein P-II 2